MTVGSAAVGTRHGDAAWLALARDAARALDQPTAREERRELLVVDVAESRYAIGIERVREIVRIPPITKIPRTPSWLLGVIALRGEIVEVLDLRPLLGLPAVEPGRRARIVVIHGADAGVAAVLVDGVRGVLRAAEEELISAEGHDFRAVVAMVQSRGEFIGVLDLERILEGGA